ncbi:lactonase family protein [Algibacter sp.]|nr:lactonase family protein [Algibacter sp.]
MNVKQLILLMVFSTLLNCKSQNIPLYVGTFTNEDSKGIYSFQFDTETGKLSNNILAIEGSNPSFIAYSLNRKYLYSVNRSKEKSEPDYVTAFKINDDGTLLRLNAVSSNGKAPCHIALNEAGNKLVISTYLGGTVSIYSINDNGTINAASQVFDHNSEIEKSHAHSAQFYKDDLFVADLGRNAIYQYKLKDDEYKLESSNIIEMKGNPGPRHFSITENGKFMYIINEYGSSIVSVKRTKDGFEKIDLDSTLSENYKGKNSCADIHLSKDERFLYGSNRGENSIVVFKRDINTGKIDKIQNVSVHGDWPRNFTIDPTGKFLLVANRKSHNIAVFSINNSTGKLSFLQDFKTPEPVCLLF